MINQRRKALTVMATLFNGFTADKIKAYDELLADLDENLVSAAISQLVKTSEFPPTVAAIRKEAERIYMVANGKDLESIGRTWQAVLTAVKRYGWYGVPMPGGGYKSVDFGDPDINEAVRRYGWHTLCETPADKMGVAYKQFTDVYAEVVKERKSKRRIQATLQVMESKGKTLAPKPAVNLIEGGNDARS